MRNTSYRQVIEKRLQEKGQGALAGGVQQFTASLATWRWQTLVKVCVQTQKSYQAFKSGFERRDFNLREDGQLSQLAMLHANPHFPDETNALLQLQQMMSRLRMLGLGCSCRGSSNR